ncbi:nucleoid-associated protein [Peribacillus frigoritolerans]|uniref:nucleoid-associated protein n=1 Tax=Peribacillus frigoritolerans TaxID=450367 RepID=UPI00207A8812|nr:nucleoid-associated protein [Peribacillus frigoritolerans]USK75893.1 nucleoid-associated protein [Peribacillus frigoritolerans]
MKEIKVKKFIAHFIDLNNENPQLSDSLFLLEDETTTRVLEFFESHISKAWTATQLKTCRFRNTSNITFNHCREIATNQEDDETFIQNTRELTIKLHDQMVNSSSRSSGTLIFLEYIDVETEEAYLSILKMDPNEGIEVDPINLSFRIRQNLLPSVREKLHKSAFIKLSLPFDKDTAKLYVLDKQQKSDGVSKFFLRGFLEANEEMNDEKMTELFMETAVEVADANELDIFSFSKKLEQRITQGENINVETLLDNVLHGIPFGDEDKMEFIEDVKYRMKRRNEDSYFIFDVEKPKDQTGYITSEDRTIRFTFPLSLFNNGIEVIDPSEENNWTTTISIENENMKKSSNLKK